MFGINTGQSIFRNARKLYQCEIEALELRRLNTAGPSISLSGANLFLRGTGVGDQITVRSAGSTIDVRIASSTSVVRKIVNAASVASITVDGGGGRDTLTVDEALEPTVVDRRVEVRHTRLAANHEIVSATTAAVPGVLEGSSSAWANRFQTEKQQAATQTDAGVVFLGDSMFDRFSTTGQDAWTAHFAALHPFNAGLTGDTTAQLLYRLQNGLLKTLRPSVVVLEVGTNNVTRTDNVSAVVAGIESVIAELRTEFPAVRIVLCGLLPRHTPVEAATVNAVDAQLITLAHKNVIRYVAPGPRLSAPDATTKLFRTDGIHLSVSGYSVWSDLIDPVLQKMLT